MTPPRRLLAPVPIDPKRPDALEKSEAGAVFDADPENDTPDDVAVGTVIGDDAIESEEIPTKELEPERTPPGPNVIPLADEEAADEAISEP